MEEMFYVITKNRIAGAYDTYPKALKHAGSVCEDNGGFCHIAKVIGKVSVGLNIESYETEPQVTENPIEIK